MLSKARCCERAKNEFVCGKSKVFWDTFSVAKTDELLYGAGIALDCGFSPASTNCLVYVISSTRRHHIGIVRHIKKGVPTEDWGSG
jgi:hypothetical protein